MHLAYSGPMTVGELARHVGRAQSVTSETVEVLASHGLLARVRDPRDKRRTLIWLTEEAREFLAREREPLDRERVNGVLSRMEPGAREELFSAIEQFVAVAEVQRREVVRPHPGFSRGHKASPPKKERKTR